jgi:hypothetical protein
MYAGRHTKNPKTKNGYAKNKSAILLFGDFTK